MTAHAITPTDKAAPLTWARGGRTHAVSSDGRYFINAAHVCGELVYQAVCVAKKPSRIVLGRGSLDECKAAVEADR